MATSRKDAAHSAPRKKTQSQPTPQPGQPKRKRINGNTGPRPLFAADKLAEGAKILAEAWRVINQVYPLVPSHQQDRADLLRRLISVHIREVEDMLSLANEISEGLYGSTPTEGGAA